MDVPKYATLRGSACPADLDGFLERGQRLDPMLNINKTNCYYIATALVEL